MHISTKCRFAVDAMIDLALREQDGPVALAGVATRQKVSLSYLEQLFAALRTHDLVRATRGPGGGYSLGRSARDISVADIVLAVDDSASQPAPRGGELAGDLWQRVDRAVVESMAGISLESLVEDQRAKGVQIERRRLRSPLMARPSTPAMPTRAANSVFALGLAMTG